VIIFDKKNGDFSFSNFTSAIRVKDQSKLDFNFLHKFLFYSYISGITGTMQSHSTGIRNLNLNVYKEIEIPVPPLPEQRRIVKILDEVFENVKQAKEKTEKNLQNSKELFESYLQNIFANPGKDWEEKKLSDIYDVRDGTHDSPKYQKEGFALITSKNLKKDELDYQKIKYISEKDYKKINERSKVDKGDILFAMIGTIGNPVVVKIEPNFAIKNVALFKIPKEENGYFLKYFLSSKLVINKMSNEVKGTTQKFVGLGYLRSFKIKIPKLSEQKIIVDKLDALSLETKKLEEIYKQKLADLEELKKSVLKKVFSGEL
jgi:type I restriction enzyme S subunit